MSLINREDAIELMCRALHYNYEEGYAVTKMLELPSTEEKTGEWVSDGKGFYKCTSCGEAWSHWWAVIVPLDRMYKELPHCPNCGAKMKPKK